MGNEATRRRIVQASIALFSEKGYTETSMREIAAMAGIQPGAIYPYFPSKQDILDYLVDRYIAYVEGMLYPTDKIVELTRDMSGREAVSALIYGFPDDADISYPGIMKIILQEQYRNQRVQEFVRDFLFVKMDDYINRYLRHLADQGKIRPDNLEHCASIINSLSIFATLEFAHFGEEMLNDGRVLRPQVVEHLLGKMVIDE